MNKKSKKIILSLSLSIILTIFGCLFSLNRVAGLPFDFKLRIFFEHFIAGLYFPAISFFFFAYFIPNILFWLDGDFIYLSKRCNYLGLGFFSLVILGVEIYFQFFKEFNNHSLLQMIYFILGLGSLWFYVIKMKLFN